MRKTKTIYSDGKQYTFTPGAGGSLISQPSLSRELTIAPDKEFRSRVIGSALDKAVAKKKRKKTPTTSPTSIGSIRG